MLAPRLADLVSPAPTSSPASSSPPPLDETSAHALAVCGACRRGGAATLPVRWIHEDPLWSRDVLDTLNHGPSPGGVPARLLAQIALAIPSCPSRAASSAALHRVEMAAPPLLRTRGGERQVDDTLARRRNAPRRAPQGGPVRRRWYKARGQQSRPLPRSRRWRDGVPPLYAGRALPALFRLCLPGRAGSGLNCTRIRSCDSVITWSSFKNLHYGTAPSVYKRTAGSCRWCAEDREKTGKVALTCGQRRDPRVPREREQSEAARGTQGDGLPPRHAHEFPLKSTPTNFLAEHHAARVARRLVICRRNSRREPIWSRDRRVHRARDRGPRPRFSICRRSLGSRTWQDGALPSPRRSRG